MSMCASLNHGDVWSVCDINFSSPIGDILEQDVFTLEELLQEDELLQEVKAKNEHLMAFLVLPESIEKMIRFVIEPSVPDDSDIRKFKFPYISCELFCCEIPEMLSVFATHDNGRLLALLFTFLDCEHTLDPYLAGYFEKVLEMIFRRLTITVMDYFNNGGLDLLDKFLRHVDNYSVMQVVQRLMLPHIPFSMGVEASEQEAALSDEERFRMQCHWSMYANVCNRIVSVMLSVDCADVASHISDLLITVIQLSPADAIILSHLSDTYCMDLLTTTVSTASEDLTSGSSFGYDEMTVHYRAIAAVSVLESLISRLCEVPSDLSPTAADLTWSTEDQQSVVSALMTLKAICTRLHSLFPFISQQLNACVQQSMVGSGGNSESIRGNRVGYTAYQLVKLTEAIMRGADYDTDEKLCAEGVYAAVINMMFSFPAHSLLHLCIQRMLSMIIEDASVRRTACVHILVECGLLERMLDVLLVDQSDSHGGGCYRLPVIGHLLQIAQVNIALFGVAFNLLMAVNRNTREFVQQAIDTLFQGQGEASEHQREQLDVESGDGETFNIKDEIASHTDLSRWHQFVSVQFRHMVALQQPVVVPQTQGGSGAQPVPGSDGSQLAMAMQALGIQSPYQHDRRAVDLFDISVEEEDEDDDDDDDYLRSIDNHGDLFDNEFGNHHDFHSSFTDFANFEFSPDDTPSATFDDTFDPFGTTSQPSQFADFAAQDNSFDPFGISTSSAQFADFESIPSVPFDAHFDAQFDSVPPTSQNNSGTQDE